MKNRIIKTIITGVALATLLTGCFNDGVDDRKYALLTGDKSFTEVKNAYSLSISNQLIKDEKIYEKWLKKYSDVDPAFDFTTFHKNTHISYDIKIQKIKNKIKELKNKKTHNKKELWKEKRSAEMLSSHFKFIKTDYLPFLNRLIRKESTKLLPLK